jgi:Gluconate 2-dehydrogenase subunit 3
LTKVQDMDADRPKRSADRPKSSSDPAESSHSRRSFLLGSGAALSAVWVASQWPSIAAAAHHAENMPADVSPAHFEFLTTADAADVAAICAQIVPSGATPGAREAHAVYFIDKSLSTYFASMAPDYRLGLAEFQARFRAVGLGEAFAAAGTEIQETFLKTVDRTPFFEATRFLTVLGLFSSPKYGGNYRGSGWKLLGFVDQHAFAPPFGYYDAQYQGFVPYSPA